jgi:hypothetical protein
MHAGRSVFLAVRCISFLKHSGELHSLHPALLELRSHAREQHAAARAALEERFGGVPALLDALRVVRGTHACS